MYAQLVLLSCVCLASFAGAGTALDGLVTRPASLCVLLGCGDGELAVNLAAGGRTLVQGLERDERVVRAARTRALATNLHGRVTFAQAPWEQLPYADGLVDLLVVGPGADLLNQPAALKETARVLACGGRLVFLHDGGKTPAEVLARLNAAGASWTEDAASTRALTFCKGWPAGSDNWPQWGHDAGQTFVSQDAAFEPPDSLQWLCGPGRIGRGTLILSAGGRNFYVVRAREAVLPDFFGASEADFEDQDLVLVARNAANGLPLWRQRYEGGAQTLVACGSELIACRGKEVVSLDAETGARTRSWGRFADVQQIAVAAAGNLQAVLLLSQRSERPGTIHAFDLSSARPLWQAACGRSARLLSDGGSVFVCTGTATQQVCSLRLASGAALWQAVVTGEVACAKDGVLLSACRGRGAQSLQALSGSDGTTLWKYEVSPRPARWNVQFAAGRVWVQRWAAQAGQKDQWFGLDPRTGAVRQQYETPVYIPYSCYPAIATEKYFVLNRPNDLMAWESGRISEFRAFRNSCQSSSIIAGGLFAGMPNACACYPGILRGFAAFRHEEAAALGGAGAERLQTGPAYPAAPEKEAKAASDEWPMFRHDVRRSGVNYVKYPEEMELLWTADTRPPHPAPSLLNDEALANPLGADPLTAPVIAGNRVLLANPGAHVVLALEAATGRELWRFACEGRLDTPPALAGGMCLFGTRAGYVYGVRAADGELAWRFRAAPGGRQIVACGQLESRWPVVGGVLVQGGTGYAVCGRSTEIDGGLAICALDVQTGRTNWCVAPPRTSRQARFAGLADLLVGDGETISIGGSLRARFDANSGQPVFRESFHALRAPFRRDEDDYLTPFHAEGDAVGSLLGRDRRYGRFGGTQHFEGTEARLLVFNDTWVFSYFVETEQKGRNVRTGLRSSRRGQIGQAAWSIDLSARTTVAALAAARNVLFAATQREDDGRVSRPELWCINVKDGEILYKRRLPEAVVPEGLALAGQRLYATTVGGHVLCFGAPQGK